MNITLLNIGVDLILVFLTATITWLATSYNTRTKAKLYTGPAFILLGSILGLPSWKASILLPAGVVLLIRGLHDLRYPELSDAEVLAATTIAGPRPRDAASTSTSTPPPPGSAGSH